MRKANVSDTEVGVRKQSVRRFKSWQKVELTAITIGVQGKISCTYWGATVGEKSMR